MLSAEQRVAVAQDIVDRLKAGRVKVQPGVYIGLNPTRGSQLADDEGAFAVQHWRAHRLKDVPELEEECRVCALGASVLAKLRLFDQGGKKDPKLGDLVGHVADYATRKVFGRQAQQIEAYFEGWDMVTREPDAKRFACLVPASRDRLEMIMQNIVDNEGEFKPEQLLLEAQKRHDARRKEVPAEEGK